MFGGCKGLRLTMLEYKVGKDLGKGAKSLVGASDKIDE